MNGSLSNRKSSLMLVPAASCMIYIDASVLWVNSKSDMSTESETGLWWVWRGPVWTDFHLGGLASESLVRHELPNSEDIP